MSFVATRSGLTRVKVFDLSARIKMLAELFIKRHNKAVDEAWYARTIDWSMRFDEQATIIQAPYNAYVRLVAKLRQRITQRHPAPNDTRANCDPSLYANEDVGSTGDESGETSAEGGASEQTIPADSSASETSQPMLADAPIIGDGASTTSDSAQSTTSSTQPTPVAVEINYANFSTFEFLDLLANSSVHISATQAIIANKGTQQRTPVGVSGLLYDYATFARRFLNATRLDIRTSEPAASLLPDTVELCGAGQECPTQCGMRNDTIDCLLVDNNAYIVVGEELPYIGRSLADFDDQLLASLVERRVYHEVSLMDYQAICVRNDQQTSAAQAAAAIAANALQQAQQQQLQQQQQILQQAASSASTTAASLGSALRAILSNFAAGAAYFWTVIYTMLVMHSTSHDLNESMPYLGAIDGGFDAHLVAAQSAVANQSLLALLPNKTYLRPCEKQMSLYELRPVDTSKLVSDAPVQFVTRCGCPGWYVYDFVPHTNLMMLIVNITSACRRCDVSSIDQTLHQQQLSKAAAVAETLVNSPNYVPVVLPGPTAEPAHTYNNGHINGHSLATSNGAHMSWNGLQPNKTAEDQVCVMLEREAQLYVRKPDTCYDYHPDELQIHLCGGALGAGSHASLLLIGICLIIVSVIITRN